MLICKIVFKNADAIETADTPIKHCIEFFLIFKTFSELSQNLERTG